MGCVCNEKEIRPMTPMLKAKPSPRNAKGGGDDHEVAKSRDKTKTKQQKENAKRKEEELKAKREE